MTKKNIHYIFMAVILLLIVIGLFVPHPLKKPPITDPGQKDKNPAGSGKWYVQFTVNNQKTTAYTEEASAPRPSNGKSYFIGGIAVHPRYPVNDGGDPRVPLLPYGTEIHLLKPVDIQGQQYRSLKVMDTGDINHRLWPGHPYWFDIYYGSTQYYSDKNARNYGTDLVDYTWFEEWK